MTVTKQELKELEEQRKEYKRLFEETHDGWTKALEMLKEVKRNPVCPHCGKKLSQLKEAGTFQCPECSKPKSNLNYCGYCRKDYSGESCSCSAFEEEPSGFVRRLETAHLALSSCCNATIEYHTIVHWNNKSRFKEPYCMKCGCGCTVDLKEVKV